MKNQMYIALLALPLLAGCGIKRNVAYNACTGNQVATPKVQNITLTKTIQLSASEKTVDLMGRVSGTLQTIAYTRQPGT